MKQLE